MTIRELFAVFAAFGLLQYPLEVRAQSAEEITVQRLVVDAHVVDDRGDATEALRWRYPSRAASPSALRSQRSNPRRVRNRRTSPHSDAPPRAHQPPMPMRVPRLRQ